MNTHKRFNIYLFLIVTIGIGFVFSSTAFARGQNEIIQSMKNRIETINQLKAAGVVGETHNGYLAFVGAAKGHEAILAAENRDRKALYAIVAKKQNTTVAVVEKNMGVVKAKRARPGEFFQNAGGAWQKK